MPRVVPAVEEKLKRAVRDAIAIDPIITIDKIQQALEKKFNHTYSAPYIVKLSKKVAKQMRLEADHKALEQRLVEVRETFRLAREQLLKIIYWDPNITPNIKQPYAEEIVKAVHELVHIDLAILDAELNAGLYKKKEEDLIAEYSYKPLPEEIRVLIVKTYRAWGRLPEETVQKMVPEELPEHAGTT